MNKDGLIRWIGTCEQGCVFSCGQQASIDNSNNQTHFLTTCAECGRNIRLEPGVMMDGEWVRFRDDEMLAVCRDVLMYLEHPEGRSPNGFRLTTAINSLELVIQKSTKGERNMDNLICYFAAHAPAVPDWFEHVSPEKPRLPKVSYYFENQQQRQMAISWAQDTGGYTFIEWLEDTNTEWDRDAVERWNRHAGSYESDLAKWRHDDKLARMTQWAFVYAKQMAKEFESGVK